MPSPPAVVTLPAGDPARRRRCARLPTITAALSPSLLPSLQRRAASVLAGPAGPAAVAAAAALVCVVGGWRGPDVANQVYRVSQISRHGVVVWDAGWYGGTFPANYSLVFPVVAAVVGLWVTTLASAAVAAACFDCLVRRAFGRRPAGSWYFALSTVVAVAVGQLAFLTGEALALVALAAVARRRRVLGAPLGVVTALASPVAAAFLGLALVGWGLSAREERVSRVVLGVVPVGAVGAVALAFPGTGALPFGGANVICILIICLLLASPLLPAPRPVRLAAALYGLVSVALFVVPTQMGNNDIRLAAYIGVPLVICYVGARLVGPAGRWRPGPPERWRTAPAGRWILAVGVVPLIVWSWAPVDGAFGHRDIPAARPGFYQPLITQLRQRAPLPVRVEVTPTRDHWEAEWVAPAFPLARGWERQLDRGYDPLFYGSGPLTAGAYHQWLLDAGVSFVALPNAPLDFAAVQEAALLRAGRVPGLVPVWRSADWELWRVSDSAGMAHGPARITTLQGDRVALRVGRRGPVTLKLRWSPYWSVPAGAGCLSRAPGDWTELHARAAGALVMTASMVPGSASNCPAAEG